MLYRISVTERGLTGIANIFRSRLSRLDDLLGAGTVPLTEKLEGIPPVNTYRVKAKRSEYQSPLDRFETHHQ